VFILKLFDRKGIELQLGDFVKISNGKQFSFYCEVTWLDAEKIIAPFHTFTFHSFEKIDAIPDNATKSTEERYNIWYVYDEQAEEDKDAESFEQYLSAWRSCEVLLEKRCYQIVKIPA